MLFNTCVLKSIKINKIFNRVGQFYTDLAKILSRPRLGEPCFGIKCQVWAKSGKQIIAIQYSSFFLFLARPRYNTPRKRCVLIEQNRFVDWISLIPKILLIGITSLLTLKSFFVEFSSKFSLIEPTKYF